MAGISNQIKWVGIQPTDPPLNIPVTESSPITTIKILSPDTQQIIQVEPGPWAASRSGVTRTQVVARAAVAASTATIYTVTAGKTLYITAASLISRATNASEDSVDIYTSASVYVATILELQLNAGLSGNISQSYNMPIKVAAGYIIKVSNVSGKAVGLISGWEE